MWCTKNLHPPPQKKRFLVLAGVVDFVLSGGLLSSHPFPCLIFTQFLHFYLFYFYHLYIFCIALFWTIFCEKLFFGLLKWSFHRKYALFWKLVAQTLYVFFVEQIFKDSIDISFLLFCKSCDLMRPFSWLPPWPTLVVMISLLEIPKTNYYF